MSRHILISLAMLTGVAQAAQVELHGPAGSGRFGDRVAGLPNGNFVVTDPGFDSAAASDVGAVHLYGPTGALIGTLTGSSAEDSIGSRGVVVLGNGNLVVVSPRWDNPVSGESDVGAVTWINASTGLSGVVTPGNSLIGANADDQIGANGVVALSTGHYVVNSANWNNGPSIDAGAVTWGNGSTGIVGEVGPGNSLVGGAASDRLGDDELVLLTNGNYVARCRSCDIGGISDAGAVAWGDGDTGVRGPISAANSLVGSSADDAIGTDMRGIGVYALSNGNYVVASPGWDNAAVFDAGAATWCDGDSGRSGTIAAANSLFGSTAGDQVGGFGVVPLVNGNYVVASPDWNNGANAQAGAATWANGSSGGSGAVSAGNSLIGTNAQDRVGSGVIALGNGHYVVASSDWNNGAIPDVGAVTWGNGNTGLVDVVSAGNSLIGASAFDRVGNAVKALINGNYVVASPQWDNGAVVDAGAATLLPGNGTTTAVVSTANSLFGTSVNDRIGSSDIVALSNGHYVISSLEWDNAGLADVGAATWGDGNSGRTGAVSAENSLIGGAPGDQVGFGGITPLSSGGYIVASLSFDNGGIGDVGAATWANGGGGLVGAVLAANSLIGTTANDRIGDFGIKELDNGEFVITSSSWDNGAIADAGAITWVRGDAELVGTIHASNSVLGTVSAEGSSMNFTYDTARDRLLVGRPGSNIVTLFTIPPNVVFGDGFE